MGITGRGERFRCLVDTACSKSVVSKHRVVGYPVRIGKIDVTMMNGEVQPCNESAVVSIRVCDKDIQLDCLVTEILSGYDMLLGMDAVALLGGIQVSGDGDVVVLGKATCSVADSTELRDKDYEIKFEDGKWTAKWSWAGDQQPTLSNWVAQYRVQEEAAPKYEAEVRKWIDNGWLQPYHGPCDGIIPLMAVVQVNKDKVRPVLDYRELNKFVSSHTADSEVCGEKLRCWRRKGDNVSILDLRSAYLQIHVDKELWKYQVVRFDGKLYCLTRLGFGLNVAPKIMSAIVHKVLASDPSVEKATDSFMDDIIVDESRIPVTKVQQHFGEYGLDCKPPVPLNGGRVLGLRVYENNGVLMWRRDNVIPNIQNTLTRRQLFSICGQLVGHYPVAGWLRVACSYVKRLAGSVGWDSMVDGQVVTLMSEIMERVGVCDPVGGKWSVCAGKTGSVWCDASSIALGVVVEIDGVVVEDNSWLRKSDDCAHINLAELESIVKGINAALAWDLTTVTVFTDSATVYGWLRSVIVGDRRVKTHGMGEALARRRLCLIKDLITECNLTIDVVLVKSASNKADALTRVPQKWFRSKQEYCQVAVESREIIRAEHSVHHFGVDRTLYFVLRNNPNLQVARKQVEDVVKNCTRCSSIDPAPIRWEPGSISVDDNWTRLAGDITHYGGRPYLTLIDCGPSRFTVWRRVADEASGEVIRNIEQVFREHGPPLEILLDNATVFKSQAFLELCTKWGVLRRFRCAYRASGNGIVERIHRTIKCMAARTNSDVLDMTYWYNVSPKVGTSDATVPANQVFTFRWRTSRALPSRSPGGSAGGTGFRVGQKVYVKPRDSRCTSVWPEGRVTHAGDGVQLEINGVPRHVADVRPVPADLDETGRLEGGEEDDRNVGNVELELDRQEGVDADEEDGGIDGRRYPERRGRPPDRFGDPLVNWPNYM